MLPVRAYQCVLACVRACVRGMCRHKVVATSSFLVYIHSSLSLITAIAMPCACVCRSYTCMPHFPIGDQASGRYACACHHQLSIVLLQVHISACFEAGACTHATFCITMAYSFRIHTARGALLCNFLSRELRDGIVYSFPPPPWAPGPLSLSCPMLLPQAPPFISLFFLPWATKGVHV